MAMATVPVTFAALPAMSPVTCDPGSDSAESVVNVELVVAVTLAAVPVVFWLRVGTSAAWIVLNAAEVPLDRRYVPEVCVPVKAVIAAAAVAEPVPPLAIATVPESCDAGRLRAVSVVIVEFEVAVTLAAVPVVFWFSVGTSAAWIVDNAAAVPSDLRYVPDVCVPVRAVIALEAVVAPVPPLAMATVPVTFAALPAMFPVTCDPGRLNAESVVKVAFDVAVTFEAVPVVFWFRVGTSAAWIALKAAAVPFDRRYVPEVCVPVRAVIPPAAVVDPVPPFAMATAPVSCDAGNASAESVVSVAFEVAVTLAAVPVVFWFSVGTSAAWIALNDAVVPLDRR